MNHEHPLLDSHARIDALLALWQERSRQAGWRRDSDWRCRAVHTVVTSLVQGRSPENDLRDLASRRAFQGVGIVESFNDIKSLEIVWPEPLPAHFFDGFLESWVEANNSLSRGLSCVDAATGLASLQHFERRVRELAEGPATTHALPMIALYTHAFHDLEDPAAFMLSADMGQACDEHMPRSVATYQRNQMTLLLNTQNSTEERLEQFGNALRRVITKHGIPGDSLHLALHPFPHEANDIRLLLRNTDPHTAAHLWGATGLLEPATPRRNSNEHLMMKTGTLHPSMGPTTPWHESYSG